MMINEQHIKLLSPELSTILVAELNAGNVICETRIEGFTGCADNHLFVWLKYPFKTPICENINGVVYRLIDDPHYWKAEYDDEKNHQTLACNF